MNLKEKERILFSSDAKTISVKGSYASSKSVIISSSASRGLHFINLNNREEAQHFVSDLYSLVGVEDVYIFPHNIISKHSSSYDSSSKIQRNAAIKAVLEYKESVNNGKKLLIVTYPEAVLELVPLAKALDKHSYNIKVRDSLSHEFLKELLINLKFERVDFVTEPGQFAVRGSIIDLFSYNFNKPYRIDFFGDEVEKIKIFDIDSQISIDNVDEITLLADITQEKVDSTTVFNLYEGEKFFWFSNKELFVKKLEEKISTKIFDDSTVVDFDWYSKDMPERTVVFNTQPQPIFNKNFKMLSEDILEKNSEGFKVYLLSESSSQIDRLKQIFISQSKESVKFLPLHYSLHAGYIDFDLKECYYTDHQIFERFHKDRRERIVEKSLRMTINELNSLQLGDYIVHIDHGVGKFGGLVRKEDAGKIQEYIKIDFKDNDVVLLSIHSLHKISKYRSLDSGAPKIHRLGKGSWQKLKNQTKSKIKDIAKELIKLYATRKDTEGFAFTEDTYLQKELEASFIYEDTPDQIKATEDIKADMEKPYPMDRLICGDVGFGKTELAIRAAFKAVFDGKQVAVLVPTTILAYQHYQTFVSRLSPFGCKVDFFSRVKKGKESKDIIEKLKSGEIDIIIGTHRLLNKEIEIKNLALLIIDEEQKFGVSAKERLRQMKVNVDTLTLTATPIPRTLQFSLLGARDMSVLNTPPPNRQPITTEIIGFEDDIIKEAIDYELKRGGQIFFVHNRVKDLDQLAGKLSALAPEAKICIAHGQMDGEEMENRVLDFILGDYDILLSTTIIENGIDIPNANTIFINNADHFGLSDLHQLRGRVGRSNTKAFCFLIVPSMLVISEDARRRLKAIESFSDLGSGLQIAMQDLDIRGAGNLLGGEQSGFITEMGFETYQAILEEAFIELNEELSISNIGNSLASKQENIYIPDCTVDTDMELLIPSEYVNIVAEKIRLYRELDSIQSESELTLFIKKVEDRFGPIPIQFSQLANIVRIRRIAVRLGFEKIILKNGIMIMFFVTNQYSDYYKGSIFAAILSYIQKHPSKFNLKEKEGRLRMSIRDVASAEKAYFILHEMYSNIVN